MKKGSINGLSIASLGTALDSVEKALKDLRAAIKTTSESGSAPRSNMPPVAAKAIAVAKDTAKMLSEPRVERILRRAIPMHTMGLVGIPNGTRIHTTVRMSGRAGGDQRTVRAVVKDGKVFVDGRSRGFDNLTQARRAAENVAGRARSNIKQASGPQAWKVTATGQTVEQFRVSPQRTRMVQTEMKL
jgi:hypothetical protein